MRDTINALFAMIGAESITDEEFDSLTIVSFALDQETYDALAEVLAARELVSTIQDRLSAYFYARGVEVTPASTARSNIFIGDVLGD